MYGVLRPTFRSLTLLADIDGLPMLYVAAIAVCLLGLLLVPILNPPRWFDSRPAEENPALTMRAVAYAEHGDVSVLQLHPTYPRPQVQADAVLIQVVASSINPCDFKFRRNPVPDFILTKPVIPGEDVAGIVVEVGRQVSKFAVGDRVAAMLPTLRWKWGAAAEYVNVKESLVARIGDDVDFVSAASLPLVALTAVQAFSKVSDIQKGQKILIQAGAGGLGTSAIQYAKKVLGLYVATTASAGKAELLKEIGADEVIDYHTTRFEDIVQDYDIVLDSMSWSYENRTLGRDLHVLKSNGSYLNVISSDWSFDGTEVGNGLTTLHNLLVHKASNIVTRGRMPRYDVVTVLPHGEQLQYVMDLLQSGTIRAVVDRQFDLSEIQDAYTYLETGHVTGKVVLVHVKTELKEY
jgi:alcohol dehydrogenase